MGYRTMNLLRVIAAALLFVCTPAAAQWQTPAHSVPIGQGGGITGFGSALPGVAGLPFVSNGAASDPSFQLLGAAAYSPASIPNSALVNPSIPINGVTCTLGAACAVNGTAFTGDVPPAAGVSGAVPAPPSGSTSANRVLGANASWVDRKPLLTFVQPAPFTGFTFPQFNAIAPMSMSGGSAGIGTVTMSTTPSDVFHNLTRQVSLNSLYAYVDPTAGVDTGSTCAQSAPCLTLQYCFTNCTATNIVGVPTGPFNTFSFDGSTAARAYHRLTFTGPATFFVNGTGFPEAPTLTFTASGNIWVANIAALPAGATIQRVSYSDTYDPGTGNLTRFPLYASQAALNTAAGGAPGSTFGWFMDTAAKNLYVAFFGNNVNTNKAKLRVYYTNANGDAGIVMLGGVFFFLDTTYALNLDGVNIQAYNSGASSPTVLIEGRGMIRQFVPPGNGTHSNGAFVYVSGMDCEAPDGDCWNFDPGLTTNAVAMSIGHNLKGWYAGDLATFGNPRGTNNYNGWSAHGGVNDIVAGSSFGKNFGPNIANTVLPGFNNSSWLVGIETVTASDGASPGIGIFGTVGQPSAVRNAWVDTCATIQEVDSLHVETPFVVFKQTNCALNVPPSALLGGSIINYARNAP